LSSTLVTVRCAWGSNALTWPGLGRAKARVRTGERFTLRCRARPHWPRFRSWPPVGFRGEATASTVGLWRDLPPSVEAKWTVRAARASGLVVGGQSNVDVRAGRRRLRVGVHRWNPPKV